MTSLFQDAILAKHYASFRPTYPSILFERIVSATTTTTTTTTLAQSPTSRTGTPPPRYAVDVGCGTGQATVGLANHFHHVWGIDPSTKQLEYAVRKSNITYQEGKVDGDGGHGNRSRPISTSTTSAGPPTATTKEQTGTAHGNETDVLPTTPVTTTCNPIPVPDQSMICVTAAQAIHWFHLPTFYSEVRRVLQPNGVLAIWCYGMIQFPDRRDLEVAIVHELYEQLLGPYFDQKRQWVDTMYRDLLQIHDFYPHDFETICDDNDLRISSQLESSELIGYLRSWSGYHTFLRVKGIEVGSTHDPIVCIEKYIHSTLSADKNITEKISVVWPIRLLMSRKVTEAC